MYLLDQKRYISASVRFTKLKPYSCRFIHDMILPNACVSGNKLLNDLVISFLCQFGSLCICLVNFLLVFDIESVFKPFHVIHILVGFNHVYMVITSPSNGIDWRFPEISNMEIVLCEPLLY